MDRVNRGHRIEHLVGDMKTSLLLPLPLPHPPRLPLLPLKPAVLHQVRLGTRCSHINVTVAVVESYYYSVNLHSNFNLMINNWTPDIAVTIARALFYSVYPRAAWFLL